MRFGDLWAWLAKHGVELQVDQTTAVTFFFFFFFFSDVDVELYLLPGLTHLSEAHMQPLKVSRYQTGQRRSMKPSRQGVGPKSKKWIKAGSAVFFSNWLGRRTAAPSLQGAQASIEPPAPSGARCGGGRRLYIPR